MIKVIMFVKVVLDIFNFKGESENSTVIWFSPIVIWIFLDKFRIEITVAQKKNFIHFLMIKKNIASVRNQGNTFS